MLFLFICSGRRFGAVDKIWKELMKQVHLDPAVMSVVDIDKMSEKLKKAFSLLEIIQKGLHTVRIDRCHFNIWSPFIIHFNHTTELIKNVFSL